MDVYCGCVRRTSDGRRRVGKVRTLWISSSFSVLVCVESLDGAQACREMAVPANTREPTRENHLGANLLRRDETAACLPENNGLDSAITAIALVGTVSVLVFAESGFWTRLLYGLIYFLVALLVVLWLLARQRLKRELKTRIAQGGQNWSEMT